MAHSFVKTLDFESPTSSNVNKNQKSTFKTNSGKKRTKCELNWIDTKRKLLVNTGQKYTSRNGKERKEKKLRPICGNTCKKNCYEKFNTSVRENIHKEFWKLGDHAKQWQYINNFTRKRNKKSRTTEGESRREYTIQYYLPLPSEDKVIEEKVCMKSFLNTLCISDRFVRTAHSKLDLQGSTLSDDRGKHHNHPVKINRTVIKSVCDHVASFQPSHCTRKSNSKLYLSKDLNINKMFSLYNEWDQLAAYESKATTLRQYRDIVNKYMNIEFCTPKKYLRNKSHSYSKESSPTEDQIETH